MLFISPTGPADKFCWLYLVMFCVTIKLYNLMELINIINHSQELWTVIVWCEYKFIFIVKFIWSCRLNGLVEETRGICSRSFGTSYKQNDSCGWTWDDRNNILWSLLKISSHFFKRNSLLHDFSPRILDDLGILSFPTGVEFYSCYQHSVVEKLNETHHLACWDLALSQNNRSFFFWGSNSVYKRWSCVAIT